MNILITILATHLVASQSYKFPNVSIPQFHVPIVNIRGVNESMVFVAHDNTDDMILTSLIVGLYSDQSVLVARGEGHTKITRGLQNVDANVILFTKQIIKLEELNTKAVKSILQNYWSPVYIVVTVRNGTETCENGKFNKTYLQIVEDCLNYIWHNHRIIRLVVSFPFTCPYHYIIYSGKKESNVGLYNRTIKIIKAKTKQDLSKAIVENSKIKDLTAGYPLRANIFDRFPTSISTCHNIEMYRKVNLNDSNSFCGLDGLVMNDFINYYKYNLTVPRNESCDYYGYVDPDTRLTTGSLACILDKKMDISFNSRFMVLYTAEQYFYLHYITTDTLSIVLKMPDVIPLWHYAFNAYGPKTGITVGFLILVLGVTTWSFAWITKEIHETQPRRLHVYIFNSLTSTMFGFPIKQSKRFYILRGTSLFCSVILLAYYQGNVNYRFTTRARYKEIMTLSQLYTSGNTLFTSPSIKTLLEVNINTEDREQAAYLNRTQLKDDDLGIGYILERDLVATITRGQDAQMEMLMNYTDHHAEPLMYVVAEPFAVYYLSYICNTAFLFTEETLCFMMRLLEAGLPNKYYVWTRRSLKLQESFPNSRASPRPYDSISVRDSRVAFFVLAVGCMLATCSFVVEVYKGRNLRKKYVARLSVS